MPGELPVLELCNKYEPNPKRGHGPLGNQYEGRMSYDNKKGDRKELVELLQTMLAELGPDYLDPSGIDGKFGGDTEEAVKGFQDEHKDFEDKPLGEDGKVGPRTADALNRAMVGMLYDFYQTPIDLTKDTLLVTLTKDALKKGVLLDPKDVKRAKIVWVTMRWTEIELKDEMGNPFSGEEYVIILPSGEEKRGNLDDDGYAKVTGIPREGCAVRFPNLEDFELRG